LVFVDGKAGGVQPLAANFRGDRPARENIDVASHRRLPDWNEQIR